MTPRPASPFRAWAIFRNARPMAPLHEWEKLPEFVRAAWVEALSVRHSPRESWAVFVRGHAWDALDDDTRNAFTLSFNSMPAQTK